MPSDCDNQPLRRMMLFTGRVQGVGFRYTVQTIAVRFDVTGFVRNRPDGRVELVAEGADRELRRFQNEIEKQMSRYIKEVQVQESAATHEFDAFRIAF